jgi:hypothetical protein
MDFVSPFAYVVYMSAFGLVLAAVVFWFGYFTAPERVLDLFSHD